MSQMCSFSVFLIDSVTELVCEPDVFIQCVLYRLSDRTGV